MIIHLCEHCASIEELLFGAAGDFPAVATHTPGGRMSEEGTVAEWMIICAGHIASSRRTSGTELHSLIRQIHVFGLVLRLCLVVVLVFGLAGNT